MNPELPQVKTGAETAPQIPGGVEYHPEVAPRGVETERPMEQTPVGVADNQPATSSVTLPPVASTIPATPVPQGIKTPTAPGISSGSAPLIAGDEDIIEKEWVDKLKNIISLTKDDPHERARVVAQLQADYLKKRYNRTLGQVDEQG